MESELLVTTNLEGFVRKRKKATLLFFIITYGFCGFNLLMNFGIIKDEKSPTWVFMTVFIEILTILSLFYLDKTKSVYNKIEMPRHTGIKVFNLGEVILLMLPLLITAYFIPIKLSLYLGLIVIIYLVIDRHNSN